jgi:hypothetical protein
MSIGIYRVIQSSPSVTWRQEPSLTNMCRTRQICVPVESNSEYPYNLKDIGWFEMRNRNNRGWEEKRESIAPLPKDLGQVADKLCETALEDAKAQVHPLLRSADLNRLGQRMEFVKAFKLALERRIAQRLALWQPDVQAVFQFEESWMESRNSWDGSIHLLVKVPRLSNAVKVMGKALDKSLLKYLKQLGWPRFQKRHTILEIQQVTPDELRHGSSYGAMFHAVYSVPVKVWPQKRRSG